MAKIRVSATVTMAITKLKMKWRRVRQAKQEILAARRIAATMAMVAEIHNAEKDKQAQRVAVGRLAATYAMVHVRHVIRCVHNREVEEMREEMVQQHWDLYAHGRVTQEWAAQTYWKQQSAAHTMQAYILGASTRKRMRLSSAASMVTALRKAMGSAAGLAERQVYRVITAMKVNLHSVGRWGGPARDLLPNTSVPFS